MVYLGTPVSTFFLPIPFWIRGTVCCILWGDLLALSISWELQTAWNILCDISKHSALMKRMCSTHTEPTSCPSCLLYNQSTGSRLVLSTGLKHVTWNQMWFNLSTCITEVICTVHTLTGHLYPVWIKGWEKGASLHKECKHRTYNTTGEHPKGLPTTQHRQH